MEVISTEAEDLTEKSGKDNENLAKITIFPGRLCAWSWLCPLRGNKSGGGEGQRTNIQNYYNILFSISSFHRQIMSYSKKQQNMTHAQGKKELATETIFKRDQIDLVDKEITVAITDIFTELKKIMLK